MQLVRRQYGSNIFDLYWKVFRLLAQSLETSTRKTRLLAHDQATKLRSDARAIVFSQVESQGDQE
jgi:hypothetical protein